MTGTDPCGFALCMVINNIPNCSGLGGGGCNGAAVPLGQRSPVGVCCVGPPELGLAGRAPGLALHGNLRQGRSCDSGSGFFKSK